MVAFSVDLIGCVFVTAISAPISPVSPPYRPDKQGPGVHPLGDLADVPADGAQGLCHLLDVGGVHLDDIPVNRHLPQVRSIPLCGELGHLLVDKPLLLLRHSELHLDVPLPICHSGSPLFS